MALPMEKAAGCSLRETHFSVRLGTFVGKITNLLKPVEAYLYIDSEQDWKLDTNFSAMHIHVNIFASEDKQKIFLV